MLLAGVNHVAVLTDDTERFARNHDLNAGADGVGRVTNDAQHLRCEIGEELAGPVDFADALGGTRWSERARQELRATGEKIGPRTPDARDRLTAQELQIAELAAAGLSNREIGERLFLSHRTIGSHLYRVFPKLGITDRAQLRAALEPRGEAAGR